MENAPLLRTTMLTVAAMLAAFALFVGTISVVAVLVTSHAVNADSAKDGAKDSASSKALPAPTAKS